MTKEELRDLKIKTVRCRKNVLRMLRASGGGHLGPAYSCLDIAAALYFNVMRHDPKNPKMEDRDLFLLSAGHKCLAQYAVLAEAGYFDKTILDTYGSLGCLIPGHPDMHKLPGVEACTGSLGHGLNLASGMALAKRLNKQDSRVFVITGDGELAEGSNWEAAALAKHHRLDNLVVFADHNKLQISGTTAEIMDLSPIAEHFRGFGWAVREIDGNDQQAIVEAATAAPFEKGKPSLIVAHTVKGKGYSKAEGQLNYHYWKGAMEELDAAEAELDAEISALERM